NKSISSYIAQTIISPGLKYFKILDCLLVMQEIYYLQTCYARVHNRCFFKYLYVLFCTLRG
ncbi:hypothetical protein, partial [Candidatus Rhabdochlamydia sp. W815]|uniref:hypothetical protein n=1 Tax=Candidatus Rhabdochlamydia sp. W815 TaxID=2720721 RepID=UPI001BFC187F